MGKPLSLLDVLPCHERVDIGGGLQIDVFGISGGDLGLILERFPNAFGELFDLASVKPDGNGTIETQVKRMNPGLMGAFLAASQRGPDEESLLGVEIVEQRSRTLGLHPQVKMLLAMGRCTFPEGLNPFLVDHKSMLSGAGEALRIIIQVASKEQAMASPRTPKPSEQPVTPPSGS